MRGRLPSVRRAGRGRRASQSAGLALGAEHDRGRLGVDGVEAFQRGSVGLFELLPRYYSDARCWREDGLLIMIAGQAAATFNGILVLDQQALTAERLTALERQFASEG